MGGERLRLHGVLPWAAIGESGANLTVAPSSGKQAPIARPLDQRASNRAACLKTRSPYAGRENFASSRMPCRNEKFNGPPALGNKPFVAVTARRVHTICKTCGVRAFVEGQPGRSTQSADWPSAFDVTVRVIKATSAAQCGLRVLGDGIPIPIAARAAVGEPRQHAMKTTGCRVENGFWNCYVLRVAVQLQRTHHSSFIVLMVCVGCVVRWSSAANGRNTICAR